MRNEYVKENRRGRILTLNKYRPTWHCAFDRGWDTTPIQWLPFFKGPTFPELPNGPDIIEEAGADTLWLWPDSLSRVSLNLTDSSCITIPLPG